MGRKQLLIEVGLNGILPWLVFSYLTESLHWSEYHGLLAITSIPTAVGLFEFFRERRVDAIAILSLVSIVIGLAMTAVTDDVRLLQVRESYLTLIIGLLMLGSVLAKKPLLYWMAHSQAQRQGTAENLRRAWEDPAMRRFFSVLTVGWGVTLLLEFAVKIWMIETMTMARVLFWSPFALYGITGLAVLGTVGYVFAYKRAQTQRNPALRIGPEDGYSQAHQEFPQE